MEEGEALKGEADEEMAVISSYLSTKDIVRSHKISPNKGMGMEWQKLGLLPTTPARGIVVRPRIRNCDIPCIKPALRERRRKSKSLSMSEDTPCDYI